MILPSRPETQRPPNPYVWGRSPQQCLRQHILGRGPALGLVNPLWTLNLTWMQHYQEKSLQMTHKVPQSHLYSWMGFANSSRQVRGKEPHTYTWATEITLWKACRHATILRPWARHPHICKSTCVNSHLQVIINVDRCPAAKWGWGISSQSFAVFMGMT